MEDPRGEGPVVTAAARTSPCAAAAIFSGDNDTDFWHFLDGKVP
jgi:hypothetical protein